VGAGVFFLFFFRPPPPPPLVLLLAISPLPIQTPLVQQLFTFAA
jgi:hypothetical protein